MGYYIETKSPKNKANQLLTEFANARETVVPALDTKGRNVLVCVVQNGPFDAAAVVYNEREFAAFNNPSDYRPKTWITLPLDDLYDLVSRGQCPSQVLKSLVFPVSA
jgi:hypothetical protein